MQDTPFTLDIASRAALQAAYMPFIANGGLLVATHTRCDLGDEVPMQVRLPDCPRTFELHGRVVWVTPVAAGGPAVGLQFLGSGQGLQAEIERLLHG